MSIAQRNEIEDLKRRVAELERLVQTLVSSAHTLNTVVSKTLTLPEKRTSA